MKEANILNCFIFTNAFCGRDFHDGSGISFPFLVKASIVAIGIHLLT